MSIDREGSSGFQEIREQVKPGAFLRRRLVDDLRDHGIIKTNKPMKNIQLFWVAATVAALAAGYVLGQSMNLEPPASAPDVRAQYALFLYENEEFAMDETPALVEEYTNWAVGLAQKGHMMGGEKLTEQSEWLGASSTFNESSKMGGYFLYTADSFEEALAIAKTHPHVRYGGGMELRVVEQLD